MTKPTKSTERSIDDFDHHDLSVSSDEIRKQYAYMVTECPVAHVDKHGGFEMVSSYAAVRDAASRADEFISGDGVFLPASGMPRVLALEFDGDEHRMWRGLLGDLLSPSAVRDLESMVTDIVNAQIDTFCSSGKVDLASAFAGPVPAIVIGRYVGLTSDESLINGNLATAAFAAVATPAFQAAMDAFNAYTLARVQEHKGDANGGLLSALTEGEYDGITVDDNLIVDICMALLLGGHHSTSSAITGLFNHVLSDHALRDAVAHDPKLQARAIEESLRLTTPLQLFARTAAESAVVEGVQIDSGARMLLNYAAANRDPEEFDNPDVLDLTRRRNRHVAFGAGPHLCLGQHLARLELRVALGEILRRLPDIQIAGEVQTSGLIAGGLMTITSLPVTFTPEHR